MYLKSQVTMKRVKAAILLTLFMIIPISADAQDTGASKIKFEDGKKIRVGFLVYNGVEAQDLNGPLDVFVKANRMGGNFDIFLISSTPDKNIKTESETVHIRTQYSIEDAPQTDILMVPGAAPDVVHSLSVQNDSLKAWMISQNKNTVITGSVCTGSLLLGDLGFLEGHKATTHPACLEDLKKIKGVEVQKDVRFTMDQKYITGSGITSGIDVALYLIEIIRGKQQADLIAKIMVYNRNGDMVFMQR